MEDFNPLSVFIHAIEDPQRRMDEPSNVRVIPNWCTHARERFEEVNVIEKSAYEPFGCVGVKLPRPTLDRFEVG
jgi:hypothetical protein